MADEEELTEEQLERRKKAANRPEWKLTIKLNDMTDQMRDEVVEFAQQGLCA